LTNLFSYIVNHDRGFAPNPFFGICTLACCKPKIRATAQVGDIVVGLAPKRLGHRLVYVMRVTEVVSFDEYWMDSRFKKKKPACRSRNSVRKYGDNIYRALQKGCFLQLPSEHSNDDGTEDLEKKQRDLSGRNVLVSNEFVYYGAEAIALPKRFSDIVVGRGHKRFPHPGTSVDNSENRLIRGFIKFFERLPRGIQGTPRQMESSYWCCRSHSNSG